MRVTHVITRLVVGGAQENTLTTLKGLRDIPGLQVSLIAGPTLGAEGSLEPEARNANIDFHLAPALVRPIHPLKDLLALRHLTRLLRGQQPDIVHTHSGKAGVLGRLAAARANVPIIIHHVHGPSFGPFQGPLSNWVLRGAERYVAPLTTHFICSANAMTRIYLASGIGRPADYTRAFSGFHLQPFLTAANDPSIRLELGLPPDAFVIGKVARMAPLKGHEDMLLALEQLLPHFPKARGLFVGDGTQRQQLEARASGMGLRDKIVFTGLVAPGAVPRHIGIMDCLVHLSSREALSRALPQALAAGKPVIAYDFDGADEVCMDGKTGFMVRMGDITTVVNRLRQLAGDPDLRTQMGQRGREFVRNNFSAEQLVDTQLKLYRRLASQRGIH